MNCEQYLSMLATLPIEDLGQGSARDHAARCRECDRATRVVAEREANMLMAFGGLRSTVPPEQVVARALATSRRRTIALYYRIGLGLATAATILYMIALRQPVADSAPVPVRETFRLQCLSPEQAAELIRPSMKLTGKIIIRPSSPLGIIRVETSPEQMAQARAILDRYDTPTASQCAVQVRVPNVAVP